MKWFTSDLHFEHKNICAYTDRPMTLTVNGHTEWLIELWNSQVKKGDMVYHLGDFFFSSGSNSPEKLKNLIKRLNGHIVFIKGNHDDSETFTKAGILVQQYKELSLHHPDTKQQIHACLFHFPIHVWHRQHRGSCHLHGHSHGGYTDGKGRILDVGLDSAYNLTGQHRFFSEQEIVERMLSIPFVSNDNHKPRENE